MKARLSIFTLAIVLTQSGCKSDSTTTLIASLGAVSTSSAVAISVASSLEASGRISEDTARRIIAYSQAVSDACSRSVASLNSDSTTRDKVLSILSAVVEVETPVIAAYGDAKAKAVVAALEAALIALRLQLQAATKDARSTGAAVSPTRQQAAEIQRIGREADGAVLAAARWTRVHPGLMALR
jgi:hypothetical protein